MDFKKIMMQLHLDKRDTVDMILELLFLLCFIVFLIIQKLHVPEYYRVFFLMLMAFFAGARIGIQWKPIL